MILLSNLFVLYHSNSLVPWNGLLYNSEQEAIDHMNNNFPEYKPVLKVMPLKRFLFYLENKHLLDKQKNSL